jgi:hypothetical protein
MADQLQGVLVKAFTASCGHTPRAIQRICCAPVLAHA